MTLATVHMKDNFFLHLFLLLLLREDFPDLAPEGAEDHLGFLLGSLVLSGIHIRGDVVVAGLVRFGEFTCSLLS